MKFKKTITFIILSTYLFLSGSFNSWAFCMGLCEGQHHKTRVIKCACCMHKDEHQVKQLQNLKVSENHCKCLKKNQRPSNINIQSWINPMQDSVYFENLFKISPLFDLIVFKNISYDKIHPNQIINSNKNLAMLRTVILQI